MRRLVQFDDIDIAQSKLQPGQELAGRGYRSHPHDPRRNAGDGGPDDACPGFNPCRFTASAPATTKAQAPSLTPDAFPAVTVPPARKGVGSFASASRLVSRGCSSALTTVAWRV